MCLVDGFKLGPTAPPHRAIVDGDTKSAAIAAASIVAKVTRDRYMRTADALYPGYGFASHVGYITPAHTRSCASEGRARSTAAPGAARVTCSDRLRARAPTANEDRTPSSSPRRSAWPTRRPHYSTNRSDVPRGRRDELDVVAAARPRARLLRGEVEERATASATRSRWSTAEKVAPGAAGCGGLARRRPELDGLDVRFDVIAERAGRLEHLADAF